MPKYSKSSVRVENPYSFLALNIFREAFRDIECYYKGQGNVEERVAGKESIEWIRKMKGNFKILAGSTKYSIEEIHQFCMRKINEIKKEAYVEKKVVRKN